VADGDRTFYLNGDFRFEDKKPVQVHANPWTGSASLLGMRVGFKTDQWSIGLYGRNLLNEDSVVSATRWLHQQLFGLGNPQLSPGTPGASNTLDFGLPARFVTPPAGSGIVCPATNPTCVPAAQYSLPRGFFGALRQQRQVGIEGTWNFGVDKGPRRDLKPSDSDGDGVTDDIDRCPGTPAGTAVDASGCPLPKDSDGDGVTDDKDRCPNTPAGARVDANGCELDADGDGVVDRLDQCPNTPAGAKVDANGCELDSDGDGVVDSKDQCPDTPKGDRVDVYGCSFKTEIKLPGVVFETNKADLKGESLPVLDGAVATLKRYPELMVEVAGHTDAQGSDGYNLTLSKSRAETVMKYLTDNGVTNTLRSRGYGERQPVASNKTEEGRQANRRVVLRILEK
jgi:outer membrane protein OmpA-like peptidoglycan-associated protein